MDPSECIGEAVAEVQPGRVSPLAVPAERRPGGAGLGRIDVDQEDVRGLEQAVEREHARWPIASFDDDGCLDETRGRQPADGRSFDTLVVEPSFGFILQDGEQR